MTVKAPLVIPDSTGTPLGGTPGAVDRTYTPIGKVNGVHLYEDFDSSSSGSGRSRLGVSLKRANAQRNTDRILFTLSYPTVNVVDGVDVISWTDRSSVEFIYNGQTSKDNRMDLRTLTINTLTQTALSTMVHDLEDIYG